MKVDWTETNYRERHLRFDGRIVGKITRFIDQKAWACVVKRKKRAPGFGNLDTLAYRRDETKAKALVLEIATRRRNETAGGAR